MFPPRACLPAASPFVAQEAFDWDVCHVVNTLQFDVRASDTKRLDVGGLLTEFGAETQDADGLKVLDLAMAKQDEALQGAPCTCACFPARGRIRIVALADVTHGTACAHGCSRPAANANPCPCVCARQRHVWLPGWTYWSLTPSTDPAKPNFEAKTLARTFARRVAGTPTHTYFDPSIGNFSFSFQPDPAVAHLPTEVFVGAQFYYPSGFDVGVSPAGCMSSTYNATSHLLELTFVSTTAAAATVPLPALVTITVQAKPSQAYRFPKTQA